jgi:hypothetical protein
MIDRKTGVVLVLAALLAPSCGDDPAQSTTGMISVAVVDNTLSEPVEGVEITLTPVGIIATTGQDGIALFEVAPGDYFVDAQVCCVGPGFIHYHEPVTATARQNTDITLNACLMCE